jgi:hypothetical protein
MGATANERDGETERQTMNSSTIYLPATKDRPAEPAPYVLTGDDVLRLARVEDRKDPEQVLKRWRQKGWLRGTKLGTELVYTLPNAIRCIDAATQEDPR